MYDITCVYVDGMRVCGGRLGVLELHCAIAGPCINKPPHNSASHFRIRETKRVNVCKYLCEIVIIFSCQA